MGHIKDENFVNIQGWMLTKLHLKGNQLIVYAVIYGFSQDDESWFTGSCNYLAEWCGTSRQTVMSALNGLIEQGLIVKNEEFRNNVKFCSYKADLTWCKNSLQEGVKKFDREVLKNLTGGCKNSLHNNIDNTIKKNIKKETIEKAKCENSKNSVSKIIERTCLENDITDDKSIELIEKFLDEMKIKTKGAIEANIAKVAGKPYSIISKCINTSYERNYRYITPPDWLNSGYGSKNISYHNSPQNPDTPVFSTDAEKQSYIDSLPYI